MPTLLLVDGHSQAYRAYFGVKTPLTTRRGELTTGVYGFTRKLLSVLKEHRPEYVAVAFDVGETWRHQTYPDYKATRERMPDDLQAQMARIEQVLRAFRIPIVTKQDYEADDVIGTLALKAVEAGFDVRILTGDRDMFQLASDAVRILYTTGGPNPRTELYGPEEIRERYGLSPHQYVDFKALVGDPSDNIPGVPGVGEKTAIKLLQQFGSLDDLYRHIDQVKGPKTRQTLMAWKEQVFRNRELIRIVTDLEIPFEPEQLRLRGYDPAEVRRLFEELEFFSLLRELGLEGPPARSGAGDEGQLPLFPIAAADTASPPAESPYPPVQAPEALEQVVQALGKAPLLGFDVETTDPDAMRAGLVGLGVAWAEGQAAYIPVGHRDGPQLPWPQVREALAPIFGDPERAQVAHNGKYDLIVCRRHGLEIRGPIHDTMTLAWLLDPASRALNLKSVAERELRWVMTELTRLIGKGKNQVTIDQAPIQAVAAYCGADTDVVLHLFQVLKPKVEAEGMWTLYEEIELPLLPVLADMEMAGVLIDVPFLQRMSRELEARLHACEQELFTIVGHPFNLRSTQQLSKVLFEEMAFPRKGLRRTRSGFISTAVSELEKLAELRAELSADQQRILELIFEHRQLEKLRSTYVDALPQLVHPETGRIHTSFNQTGTSTGRLSSSNPNLQNIPIRTEMGREIRRAFVAPEGWLLLAADYSQVELRILAHITQEPGLLEAFRQDLDIHAATASKLFGVPVERVDAAMRRMAKTINFATIYGVSAYGLSSRTEMSTQEAQHHLDQYFRMYPRVRQYIQETIHQAREQGYVQTLLGRKRYFPELKDPRLPHSQRQALERAAINAPIQGTAADIIKLAMVRLHRRLQEAGHRARMILQVHDELLLELPQEERDTVPHLVRETMELAYPLSVPLKVDAAVGPNWLDMEPIPEPRETRPRP